MHLNIDQAWCEQMPLAVHHLDAFWNTRIEKLWAKIGDGIADGQQRALYIQTAFGIEQAGIDVSHLVIWVVQVRGQLEMLFHGGPCVHAGAISP